MINNKKEEVWIWNSLEFDAGIVLVGNEVKSIEKVM
jgi:tmRNA-binding protein